jgi:retinol dehydrogenase 14
MPVDVRRLVLVTGASSGIGRALATRLAGSDATVGIVGRDRGRLESVRAETAARHGNDAVRAFPADLSELASVRGLAAEVAGAFPHLDGLVHCAGVYTAHRLETQDGLEAMFATNVAAPFLLTNLVLPLLARGQGRVLVLSAPSTTRIDFDDLQAKRQFRSLTAFGATKAAGLAFTFELARRVAATGVTANAVHPGVVRTSLMREAPAPVRWASWLVSRTPERATADIAPLITSPAYAGTSGRFYKSGRQIDPPRSTTDPATGRRLWAACAELTGISSASIPDARDEAAGDPTHLEPPREGSFTGYTD